MSSSTLQGLLASICATSVLVLTAVSSPVAAQIVSLPSYNVDINQTSVSGLSAGGYMAVQFDVAFSSTLRGAGIIAGGHPYDQGHRRHRRPARHIGARSHHRRQERAREFEGDAADLRDRAWRLSN